MQPRQQQPGQPDPCVGRLLRGGPRQFPTLQPPGRADGGSVSVLHARWIEAILRFRQNRAGFPHRAPRERLREEAHHRSVTFAGFQQPFSADKKAESGFSCSLLCESADVWTRCWDNPVNHKQLIRFHSSQCIKAHWLWFRQGWGL